MVIDGKKIADEVLDRLKPLERDPRLQLAAILVGGGPELKSFVRLKKKAAESVGIVFTSYEFEDGVPEQEILRTIEYLNTDPDVHGIFVELPLPAGYDREKLLNAIAPEKDVDMLTGPGQVEFYDGRSRIVPPAVKALQYVLEKHAIEPKGKQVAVFGHGFLVGKPITYWLVQKGAQVAVVDKHTANPRQLALHADIIISGAGSPGLITGEMVKEGAVVVDFGYAKEEGKMVGDVDYESVAPKASLITPVPGGMGPLVVAAVLENLILLQEPKP